MDRAARGAFFQRLDGGDLLLFLYAAVIARQYLSWLPLPASAAWFVSAVAAAFLSWRYVIAKTERRVRLSSDRNRIARPMTAKVQVQIASA